jgi:hypothetical protein
MEEHNTNINMPKKKNPQIEKLKQQSNTKIFFDSADYEIKRASEKDLQKKEQIREEALKSKHAQKRNS